MTQNQIEEENTIIKNLLQDSKDCYELLHNIIIKLETKIVHYESLNKLLYSCILTIFTNNSKIIPTLGDLIDLNKSLYNKILTISTDDSTIIPDLDNIITFNKNNFIYFCSSGIGMLKFYFEQLLNYNFNNFYRYIVKNDNKIPLKIMNYIPINKLEYFIHQFITVYSRVLESDNEPIFRNLFLTFINEKIKSGYKDRVSNLIHILVNKCQEFYVIRNLGCTIFELSLLPDCNYKYEEIHTIEFNKIKYICLKYKNLILLIDKVDFENFTIQNYSFEGCLLTFTINYFSRIVEHSIDCLYNTHHLV